MERYKGIFLGFVCLLTTTVGAEAQGKCKECPALSKGTTPVCGNNQNCSVVASQCRLLKKGVKGSLKISTDTPAKPIQIIDGKEACVYPTTDGGSIIFDVQGNQ